MICSTVGHIAQNGPNKEDRGENTWWALAGLVAGDLTDQDWMVDSRASTQQECDVSMLYEWEKRDEPDGVVLSDKSTLRD